MSKRATEPNGNAGQKVNGGGKENVASRQIVEGDCILRLPALYALREYTSANEVLRQVQMNIILSIHASTARCVYSIVSHEVLVHPLSTSIQAMLTRISTDAFHSLRSDSYPGLLQR